MGREKKGEVVAEAVSESPREISGLVRKEFRVLLKSVLPLFLFDPLFLPHLALSSRIT